MDEDIRYVVSPLATLRWRQGQLVIASPTRPRCLEVDASLLGILRELGVPRTGSELNQASLDLTVAQREAILQDLLEAGVVETHRRPQGKSSGCWWDPHDLGRADIKRMQLLQIAHGTARSNEARMSVDGAGLPVPWLARPIVDFLDQLDLRDLSVFEFGGGASTLFWGRRGARVTCVESNRGWAERLTQELGAAATVIFEADPAAFPDVILRSDDCYDVVLIDAQPRYRMGCAGPALARLSPRGMIILDDAPFYPGVADVLRRAGLLEVDVTGFCALEDNLQTTSLFLSPSFNLPRLPGPSPRFPFGSPGFCWPDPLDFEPEGL